MLVCCILPAQAEATSRTILFDHRKITCYLLVGYAGGPTMVDVHVLLVEPEELVHRTPEFRRRHSRIVRGMADVRHGDWRRGDRGVVDVLGEAGTRCNGSCHCATYARIQMLHACNGT